MRRLLARLDDPQDKLPPVVHVAGTNGKGSTLAFLRAMLEAAGWRVHVYSSPHLVRFNERIRLAGALIEDEALLALLEEVEAANDGAPITFFEVTTAAAFLAFARMPADIVLLETGLGGRFDATNVVKRPAVTAITRISHDHAQFLGDDLGGIAREKAGIMRPGVPVVIQRQPQAAAWRALRDAAESCGAPIYPGLGEGAQAMGAAGWTVAPTAHGFRYESAARKLDLPPPGLLGRHQLDNAGAAIACLERLHGLDAPDDAIRAGLRNVDWPARLQRLTRGPLADALPPGWELWLDGAHNDSGGEALAAQAKAWGEADGKKLDLVFAALRAKIPAEVLAPLAPYAAHLTAAPIPGHDAFAPEELAEAARALGMDAAAAPDFASAVRVRFALSGPPRRVVICGSLYLAGEVLRENG